MCGILGEVQSERRSHNSDRDLALRSLSHRGPDGQSTWQDEHCFLGHRRLAIIDLSEAATEPMGNEDDSAFLNFNGEIYNFRELRRELEVLGHRFRSQTDAEVALHAYEEWGTSSVNRLRGMFAFVVWDARTQTLFAARDRLGKKPFYYCEGNGFRFASELQGLLKLLTSMPAIDLDAIDLYFRFGYVPAPLTGFKGIRKLPPAHWMTVEVTRSGLSVDVQRYWNLDYLPKHDLDEGEAAERLRAELTEAVAMRLVSDRPLGAFLSGGIDSSIVVGLMSQLSKEPVRTFSIGFTNAKYNELEHARRIAERWGTEHHEFMVTPDALEVLPLLVRHYGEPYADSSAIPTYYLARETSRSVTVALNGDGGDESFGGYERHVANLFASRAAHAPGAGLIGRGLDRILPDSGERKSKLRKLHRFLEAVGRPLHQRYGSWVGLFDSEQRSRLWGRTASGEAEEWFFHLAERTAGLGAIDSALLIDIHSYLPNDLLVKVDIASMANSLECRSPFLDQNVVEFAARLPERFKAGLSGKKVLLRKAFAELLPVENVRRPKMGFAVPIGDWLRGSLRPLIQDTLLDGSSRIASFVDRREVTSLVDGHLKGRELSAQVWSLLMLEMWMREVVDHSSMTGA